MGVARKHDIRRSSRGRDLCGSRGRCWDVRPSSVGWCVFVGRVPLRRSLLYQYNLFVQSSIPHMPSSALASGFCCLPALPVGCLDRTRGVVWICARDAASRACLVALSERFSFLCAVSRPISRRLIHGSRSRASWGSDSPLTTLRCGLSHQPLFFVPRHMRRPF